MGPIFNILFLNKVVVGPVNNAQCLLYSVIHVYEQSGLLFISLNALFMARGVEKKKKNANAKSSVSKPHHNVIT